MSDWHSMPPYDGRLGGRAVRPLRRGVASSEAETSYLLEGGSLPSSEAETSYLLEAEMQGAVEGSRREPSSEVETTPQSEGSVDGPHRVGGPRVGLL